MEKKVVSQPQDKYVLRLPDGMRERLKAAAESNGRSMNAEIVTRLQTSFDAEGATPEGLLHDAIEMAKSAANDMANQAEILKWSIEQQTVSMRLLEMIANTDGRLKPEFVEMLRGMLSRRGREQDMPKFNDQE